ncbi:Schizosaccharomyces specific protein [Schizosaccharomyces osmophilus]|uniref:Schizosaccharomyces specific protein n=1 Tax=Schizosaccharomyces osmophilus TaxID=2545709 RepID=A0AAE9WFD3_9SCHI|nr:Schizosaccharomyces specific protein [Schizosaccharomyces osmophilus]WBW75284.1 Schizosaccharomyces specific protein [Schizosaccharomyces osmophilus]
MSLVEKKRKRSNRFDETKNKIRKQGISIIQRKITRKLTLFERLPYELLTRIFLMSKNDSLAAVSPVLWNRLGIRDKIPSYLYIDFTLCMNPKSVILAIQRSLPRRYFTLQLLNYIDDLVAAGYVQKSQREELLNGKVIHAGHKGHIPRRILFQLNARQFIEDLKTRNFSFKISTLTNGFLIGIKMKDVSRLLQVGHLVFQEVLHKEENDVETVFQPAFEQCIIKDSVDLLDIVYGFWFNLAQMRWTKFRIDGFLAQSLEFAVSRKATNSVHYLIGKGAIPQLATLLKFQ